MWPSEFTGRRVEANLEKLLNFSWTTIQNINCIFYTIINYTPLSYQTGNHKVWCFLHLKVLNFLVLNWGNKEHNWKSFLYCTVTHMGLLLPQFRLQASLIRSCFSILFYLGQYEITWNLGWLISFNSMSVHPFSLFDLSGYVSQLRWTTYVFCSFK